MDKYEYKLKTEHIKKMAAKKEYAAAADLCDSIDWSRVKDVKMLTLVSDVYAAAGRHQEAIDLLVQAYQYAPIGRRIVYRLTELAIEAGSFDDAKEFYEEFCQIAPGDQGAVLLRYKLARAKQETEPAELIEILEEYKEQDFDERWAYELASLYAEAGRTLDCAQLCDDIILWFGMGKYVEKALDLKAKYVPLTEAQKQKAMNLEQLREEEEELPPEQDAALEDDAAPQQAPVDDAKVKARLKELDKEVSHAAEPAIEVTALEAGVHSPTDATIALDEVVRSVAAELAMTAEEAPEEETGSEAVVPEAPLPETVTDSSAKLSQILAVNQSHTQEMVQGHTEIEEQVEKLKQEFDFEQAKPQIEPEPIQTVSKEIEQAKETLEKNLKQAEAVLKEEPSLGLFEEITDQGAKEKDSLIEEEEYSLPENPADLSQVWHFIVKAKDKELGLKLAIAKLKELSAVHESLPATIAKTQGERLNKKGIVDSFDKLLNRTVIIESAGQMNQRVLDEFCKVLDRNDRSLLVILIDTPEQIGRIMDTNPKLKKVFAAQFTEVLYTAEELHDYAVRYADEHDSAFDTMAEQILYERIEEILKADQIEPYVQLKEMLDAVIGHANRKSFGKSLKGLFVLRYDEEGRIIIRERDFGDLV